MLATSHKNLVPSIYEAVSVRSRQNLEADYFALLIVDPLRMECDVFIDKQQNGDPEFIESLKRIGPRCWLISKDKGFSQPCECNENKCADSISKTFADHLKCCKTFVISFELEDLGGCILVWAWVKPPKELTQVYRDKAKLIAEQIKLTLKLSFKEEKSRELNSRLTALLELSTAIYSSLNYKDVLNKALKLSMKILAADGGSLFILDKKKNILEPLITFDKKHAEEISRISLRLGEGITGLVAQTGIGLISNHTENDPRVFQVPGTPQEPESIISAPLTWSGEVIGAITLRSSAARIYKQEDLDVLMIFARQTADAIENAKLFESLENAYKELSNTQEQLIMTEKLRALGEMAGGVAHDFNNVLGAILGRTQLLIGEMDNPKWIEHLRQIESVTLTGAKTVQKLQNFTRISGRNQFEHVDLDQVVLDAIETTKPRWKDECQLQGININLRYEKGDVDLILGNKTELVEAVSNLILNAIDALPRGGDINLKVYMEEQKAYIEVTDDGIGMSPATLNRVFYPFFTTKGTQNTGMGLAVVYGIITRHKGEIDVQSKLGEGTTFTISLQTAGKVEPKVIEPVEISTEVRARILFIDDDENIRDVVNDMLQTLDHTPTLAVSGEEGVEKFKKGQFDLVITDLGMPGISGWEVTKICKEINPNIPIIMVSGWGHQIDDDMVEKSGLDAVMAKPFEIRKIKALIQQVLARRAGEKPGTIPVSH